MNITAKKIIAAAAVCAMLALPCGCADKAPVPESDGTSLPISNTDAVSVTDVSSGDVSAADVSSSDAPAGWYETLSAEQKAVADVVLRSAEAMNTRDIDAYMSTVDPESKVYDITREDTQWVFGRYRLAVTVDSLTVDSIKGDTAVVTVTQTTLPLELEDVLVPVSGSDVTSSADVSAADVVSFTDPNPLTETDYTYMFDPCVTELTHTLTMRSGSWYITSTVIESYREISTQWDLFAAVTAADPSGFVLSGTGMQAVSSGDAVSAADAVSSADIVQ